MTSPEELFERFRERGDVAALGAVFDALAPELILVAAHVAPRGVEPQDLLQAAFVDAIESASRWDATRPLAPWLVGILLNHARHERRRSLRRVDPARVDRPQAADPADAAERQEIAERVAQALLALPRHYRQVLTLRLVNGLTPTEIAAALGCPVSTVKTRMQRGLEHLRRALPVGIATTLAGLVFTIPGLSSARAAVVAHATKLAAAAVAHAAAWTCAGVVMKKSMIGAAGAVLLVSGWLLWPSRPIAASSPSDARAVPRTSVMTPRAPSPEQIVHGRTSVAPEVAEPTDAAQIHGRVVDEFGRPLQGVDVELGRALPDERANPYASAAAFVWSRATSSGFRVRRERATRTATDGSFAFDAPLREAPAVIGVWSPSRGGTLVPVPDHLGEPMLVTLPDHGQFTGRVLDDRGYGVPDCQIAAYPERSGTAATSTTSDAAGAFRTAPLPAGSYRMFARTPAHEERWVDAVLEDGRDTIVELRLTSFPVLSALLVDASGAPWTAARIAAECGIASQLEVLVTPVSIAERVDAHAGANRPATLEFDGVRGRVTGILPSPRRRDPEAAPTVAFLSVWNGDARLGEAPLESPAVERVELTLRRADLAEVRVRIAFEDAGADAAAPVPVVVRAERPGGYMGMIPRKVAQVTTATRDAILVFPARIVESLVWLSLEAPGHMPREVPVTLPPGAAVVVRDVQLSRRAHTLQAVVVDAGGDPVEAARVYVVTADGAQLARSTRCRATTDRHGSATVTGLHTPELRVMVDAGDQGLAAIDVDLRTGSRHEIRVAPPRFVEIVLPDPNGARIRALDAAGRATLDERVHGMFRFGGRQRISVPPDSVALEAFRPAGPRPFARGRLDPATGVVEMMPVAR